MGIAIQFHGEKKGSGNMGLILLIIVIMLLIGAFPQWPYSREWGYGPSGAVSVLLLLLIILMLFHVVVI
jgi:hypothetical protein